MYVCMCKVEDGTEMSGFLSVYKYMYMNMFACMYVCMCKVEDGTEIVRFLICI